MMKGSVRIGKILGIEISVDWSWLFVFMLVTGNLAVGLFPEIHPDWGSALIWITAVLASLLFFGSVLAHELAHSLVARARGLPVRNITLFLFGGVSNIQKEPQSAKTEFLMAIVGPLTSIILGFVFILLAGAGINRFDLFGDPMSTMAALNPLQTLLLWLGPINIVLGIFNLVPGFPLDGGRVLRSILWGATNNLRRSTQIAAWVGQAVAWVFIAAGVAMIFGVTIPFFGTGLISGLWLAFIGWFLQNAASQSYQQVVIQDLLGGVPVEQMMRPNAPTVPPQTLVSELVHGYIMGTDEQAFPVVENDRLVGMVCLEDVRKVPRAQWEQTLVQQIMTPSEKLATATPREDASQALNDLTSHDVRQLPVVQNGHLVGMLRLKDIMRWLQLHSQFAAH